MKLAGKQKNILIVEVIFLVIGLLLLVSVGGSKGEPTTGINFEEVNKNFTGMEELLSSLKTTYTSKFSKILVKNKEDELNNLKKDISPDSEEIKLIEINGKVENIEIEVNNYTSKLKFAEDNEKKYNELNSSFDTFKKDNSKDIAKFKSVKNNTKKVEDKLKETQVLLEKVNTLDDYSVYDEISKNNYTIQILMEELNKDLSNQKAIISKKETETKVVTPPPVKDPTPPVVEDNPFDTPPPPPPPPPKEKKVTEEKQAELLKQPSDSEINYPSKFNGGNPCMVEVNIDKTGNVVSTKVYIPSGNDEFDKFCEDIAKKMFKFKPAEKVYDDGSSEKVESTAILPFKPPSK
ncbi:MAG: hypothetical protein PHV06_04445 [bacterium]|nr:hypothetical protein [bacterium]